MKAEFLPSAGERKFVGLVLDEVEPDGSFSGYASLFGKVDLGKDIVERLWVRTLDNFYAESNLLSTAFQLRFQLTPSRSLQGREIVLFSV